MRYLDIIEARTIPRQGGGGFSKATTHPDAEVTPTPEALEGGGLSKAQRRERMMKANKKKKKPSREDAHTAYQQIGDILAEALLGESEISISQANRILNYIDALPTVYRGKGTPYDRRKKRAHPGSSEFKGRRSTDVGKGGY